MAGIKKHSVLIRCKNRFSLPTVSVFITLLLLSLVLFPHDYDIHFEQLFLKYESSQQSISTIVQDKKGYMWFGTSSVLKRFDGYDFKTYKDDPTAPYSLRGNYIRALLVDRFGTLWVGTQLGGLNKYLPGKDGFIAYRHSADDPASISSDYILTVYEDHAGTLWLGTHKGGLEKFDRATGKCTHYKKRDGGLSGNVIKTIYEDGSGNFWVGTKTGLNLFDRATGDCTRYIHDPENPYSISNSSVTALYEDEGGNLWVGTGNGLNRFDESRRRFTAYKKKKNNPHSLNGNVINAIHQDRRGTLWVGTSGGLTRYNRETDDFTRFQYHSNASNRHDKSVTHSIYEDRQGILWIGTFGSGIIKFDRDKRKFRHFHSDSSGLYNNIIFSFCQQPKGTLWIASALGTLNKMDMKTNRITAYHLPDHLVHQALITLAPDDNGIIWAGTFGNGFFKFTPETGKFLQYKNIPGNTNSVSSDYLRVIKKDPSGTIWLATRYSGLDAFNPQTGTFTHYLHDPDSPTSLTDNEISTLTINEKGESWAGTYKGGLNKFSGKGFRRYYLKTPSGTPSDKGIKCIYVRHPGVLWLGTSGEGLIRLDVNNDSWTFYSLREGLPDNVVYGILEDAKGNLWVSTNKGLSKFRLDRGTFTNYGIRDGLQADEFNTNAYYKCAQTDEMFFGGINGFNQFLPRSIKSSTYVPPVVITAFKKFNKPEAFDKDIGEVATIRFPSRDNFFSFEFAALDYRNPGKNLYAYKMENFDKDWIQSGTRRYAAYTNLGGGVYTFRVKGANSDGLWNEEGTSVRIIITPPLWKVLWFRIFVGFSVLLLFVLFYRRKLSNEKRHRNHLESEVKARTCELETARENAERARGTAEDVSLAKSEFLARMSHEIRTPMNAVIGFTDMLMGTSLNDEQQDFVRTISGSSQALLALINDILDTGKIESGRLSLDLVDFDPEKIAYEVCNKVRDKVGQKAIKVRCRMDQSVPSYVKGDPERFRQVLHNFMNNALKFTSEGYIQLSLEAESHNDSIVTLHTRVEDTGIGIPGDKKGKIFEAFQQGDGSFTRRFGGSGLGLTICKQVAHMMGGEVYVDSEEGEGSTFHFIALFEKSEKRRLEQVVWHSLPGKRVLLTDNKENSREELSRLLIAANMKVQSTGPAEDIPGVLLKAAGGGEPFDVCIMDAEFGDTAVCHWVKRIREMSSPVADIILLSILPSGAIEEGPFLEAGFDGFLHRPVRRLKMLEQLEQLFTRKRVPEEKKSVQPDIPEGNTQPGAAVKIMLVEDNPINLKLARYMLTRGGYSVIVANNGKEAVDIYARSRDEIDLIFMDIQMPEMDGLEAAKLIRRMENAGSINGMGNTPGVPIVAMTAQTMPGDREKCLRSGMDDYVPKPIKRDIVFSMVKKWALHLQ
ncbi:MAG: response regulator [bacterium]|nr:response regulator [bacterium]